MRCRKELSITERRAPARIPGKSSLLRIMAGEITEHRGGGRRSPNHSVGYLSQEPRLDSNKVVLGNIEEGVASTTN